MDIKYVAVYGSGKDVSIYRDLGLQAQQIFIVGKASKKLCSQAQVGLGSSCGKTPACVCVCVHVYMCMCMCVCVCVCARCSQAQVGLGQLI